MKSRITTLVALLAVSWVVMLLTHEFGHILGGWCGGATLVDYDLAPWRLPYSLHSPDPHPRLTLWAGPLVGAIFPLCVAAIVSVRAVWFVADFCLIANGGYLMLAWITGDRLLDTPRMMAAGVHPGLVAIYCLATIGLGYVWFRADCIAVLRPDSRTQHSRSAQTHAQDSERSKIESTDTLQDKCE
ncbi:hypothetical protein [Rubripirellula tenax]|nr:hypothetical protein [Rubripirellula tenax]